MPMLSCRRAAAWIAVSAVVLSAMVSTAAQAQALALDPAAVQILKRMTDYMAGLQQFSVDTRNTLEAVLVTGEKIQFDSAASAMVRRPNKLRAERKNDIVSQEFFYDGKTLTLYDPVSRLYAAVAAPGTIEGMLDFARDQLDIVAPASDFLYRDAFDEFMQVTTSGWVVGKAAIDGVPCDQLAFSGPEVDWQVWIADSGDPLPRKFVITTKGLAGAPQFTAVMGNWKVSLNLGEDRFRFAPPAGAKQIEFLTLEPDDGAAR